MKRHCWNTRNLKYTYIVYKWSKCNNSIIAVIMLVRNNKGELCELKQESFNTDREFYKALRQQYSNTYDDKEWQNETHSSGSVKNIVNLLNRSNNQH